MNLYLNKKIIAVWVVPFNACLKPISSEEIKWKKELSSNRAIQYEHSRGYVREALSHILEIPALKIPLKSPPGSPPELPAEMGNVSFSHCRDVLLIGWSLQNIGVDIGRSDRIFEAKKILDEFYSNNEKKSFKDLNYNKVNSEVLKLWVRKEAAIKWQKGSIFNDLSKWNFNFDTNILENKKDGYNLKSFFINYEDWYISVAYSNNNSDILKPIICKY